MDKLWRLRAGSLFVTATARFAVEDVRGFSRKILERLRYTKASKLAELLQRLFFRGTHRTSLIEAEFIRRNYSVLAELASTDSIEKLSRADRKLVRRAVDEDSFLRKEFARFPPMKPTESSPRVLFYLTNSLPHTHSGYAYRTQSTLKALQNHGIHVEAITRIGYPITVGRMPRAVSEEVDGITYTRMIPAVYPGTLKQRYSKSVDEVVRIAIQANANILHTTTDFNNALIVSEAANQLGIPWVYEVRGELERTWLSKQEPNVRNAPETSEFYQRARAQETAAMKAANAVVALSDVSKRQLIGRGVEAEKIDVIPNAVDSDLVGQGINPVEIRNRLGLPDGKIVGSVTSVVEYEGLDDLVRALDKGLEATVLIVGDGVYLPELKQLTKELGVEDRVIFTGRQQNEDIWQWYAAMDVFVVPRKDTLVCRTVTPMKPVMAQALGIPVVTTDLPALREITGGLAYYVQPGDAVDLANVLNTVFQDDDNRRASIDWARNHTWEANAVRFSEMYNRLITS